MDMASGLALWERDPFFVAAEDVQQSADRLESTYRTWLHSKDFRKELDKCICSRELITAFDTTKWQLEEFEKAVTEAMQTYSFNMGEDAPKRHHTFIEAVKRQVHMIEMDLWDITEAQISKPFQSASMDEEDRDQLAMFLSGGRSGNAHLQMDGRVHPIDDNLPSEGCLVSLLTQQDQLVGFRISDEGSDECCNLDKRQISSQVNCGDRSNLGAFHEDTPFDQTLPVNGPWHENTFICPADGQTECIGNFSFKQKTRVSLIDGQRKLKRKLLQISRNGCKGWKVENMGPMDGTENKLLLPMDNNGFSADVESDGFGRILKSTNTVLNRCIASGEKHGLRGGFKQHVRTIAVSNLTFMTAFIAVAVLGLFGMYFWFLTSIVPSINTMLPGISQD